jgi:hypothetical protein
VRSRRGLLRSFGCNWNSEHIDIIGLVYYTTKYWTSWNVYRQWLLVEIWVLTSSWGSSFTTGETKKKSRVAKIFTPFIHHFFVNRPNMLPRVNWNLVYARNWYMHIFTYLVLQFVFLKRFLISCCTLILSTWERILPFEICHSGQSNASWILATNRVFMCSWCLDEFLLVMINFWSWACRRQTESMVIQRYLFGWGFC